MMYRVEYFKAADKTLRKWKKSNPQLFKKAFLWYSSRLFVTFRFARRHFRSKEPKKN